MLPAVNHFWVPIHERCTMKARLLSFLAYLALCFAVPGHAAPITYTWVDDPVDQNGWTLSGSITTDGTIGTLTSANIDSWIITFTKGLDTKTLSSAAPGASVFVGSSLIGSLTQLTNEFDQLLFAGDGGTTQIDWAGSNYGNSYLALFQGSYLFCCSTNGFPAQGPWVVATAAPSNNLPEPSGWALAALGLGVAGVTTTGRRSRQA